MRIGIILLLSWLLCLPGLSTAQAINIIEKDIEVYGFNMHYAEAGQGPPVIVLHGLTSG